MALTSEQQREIEGLIRDRPLCSDEKDAAIRWLLAERAASTGQEG